MISVVFDCVVYVQVVLSSKGPAFACLSLAEQQQITLYLSPDILDEVKRSLDNPSLRRKYPSITDERVTAFLERVVNAGTLTENPPSVFALRRDPKDEPYVNLAIATHASFLVSRDKDLLSLMTDDIFRAAYPHLTIVDPSAFLARVRAEAAKKLANE